jgi:hypothetical protein
MVNTAKINIWLDRNIDPTSQIDIGTAGPTVWHCVLKLADTRNAVVFPVGNVLLIGTPDRVDATASELFALQSNPSNEPKRSFQWERLTTPNEAFAVITDGSMELQPLLPHDLWAETHWRDMTRSVAAALVLAQVGRQLDQEIPSTPAKDPVATRELLVVKAPIALEYPLADIVPAARRALEEADPHHSIDTHQDRVTVVASIQGHRRFTTEIVQAIAARAKRPVAGAVAAMRASKQNYTFRLINKSAGEALASLAASANVAMEIDADATSLASKLVTLELNNLRLPEVFERIAAEANLRIVYEEQKVRVSR